MQTVVKLKDNLYFLPGVGYAANSFLITSSSHFYIIDPNVDPIEDDVVENKSLAALFGTHGHFDHHLKTSTYMQKDSDLAFYLHEKDHIMAENTHANASALFGLSMRYEEANRKLDENVSVLLEDDLKIKVLHTPGHSPGSVCLLLTKGDKPYAFFTGDTIFSDGIGRADLYCASYEKLLHSLEKIYYYGEENDFPDDLLILSGHGNPCTWLELKNENPWLIQTIEEIN